MNKLDRKNLILYILMILILFGIPIYTVAISTDTLKGGNEFLFKVAAFDPYDMFRGNYLDISFEERYAEHYDSEKFGRDHEVYVTIEEREDGFAYFSRVSHEKPNNTSDYYKTKLGWNKSIKAPERYYMNENKSLNAEKIYDENMENTYVKVRVKNGKMVIVGVYVDDVLIDSIEPSSAE